MAFEFFALDSAQVQARSGAWEGLSNRRAFGWAAVNACPHPDLQEIDSLVPPLEEIPLTGPVGSMPEWDQIIRQQVRELHLHARSRYQDDSYPSLAIPRDVHGQSQGIAQLYGCTMVEQTTEPGLYYPEPWIQSPTDLAKLTRVPLEQCMTGRAIDFAAYAHEVTGGELAVRNPVTTGPIDSANYILGTMQLMQWIYDAPQALHDLLAQITESIVDIIHRLQAATGGMLCPDHCVCLPRGFALCSEVRHLLSADAYAEFEAPYLRSIGQQCGPYMIHSCGTWERMLPLDMTDDNLMMVHFQTREMNLKKVWEHTQGQLSLYVGPSVDLSETYTWPSETDFYRHLMSAFPQSVPLSFSIGNLQSYMTAQQELQGGTAGMFRRVGP